MSALLNDAAAAWAGWMLPMAWQVGLVVLLVAVADLVLRRWAWPQLRSALWLLVLVKLLLPPTLASPIAVVPLGSVTPLVAAPEHATVSGIAWLAIAWLTPTLLFAGIWIFRYRRVSREMCARGQAPSTLLKIRDRTAQRLGLRRKPAVLLSRRIRCPAVVGILRPTVLVPVDFFESMSRKDLEHVLLHELAHVKRGDLIVQALFSAAQLLFWFHPLVWLARRRAYDLRELCCDATVAATLKEQTPAYRRTLLRSVARLLPEGGLATAGFIGGPSAILSRLHWLEKESWRRPGLRRFAIAVVVLATSACVLPMARPAPDTLEERLVQARETARRALDGESSLRLRHAVLYLNNLQDQADAQR